LSNLINISEETTYTLQVNFCDFEVSTKKNDSVERVNITGLIIKPNWVEVKPKYFRSKIINRNDLKSNEKEKVSKDLRNGIYYLNIENYNDQELIIASNFLATEWTNIIWSNLIRKDNDPTITLKDNVVLKHILKQNHKLFKSKFEFDEFCRAKGLNVSDFIISGTFSSLENKLQEIAIRIEMEQFYARRFLFTETLINKLNNRLLSYGKNNEIEKEQNAKLQNWITELKHNNSNFEKFKNLQQLYEMPKQNIKIENSKNVTFVNGDVKDSKLHSGTYKTENKTSKLVWLGIILAAVVSIMEIIIYWDEIIKIFNK
jgi:hypothetical protein